MMSAEPNTAPSLPLPALFARYHVGWETRDPARIASLHAEDSVFHVHDGSAPVHGRDALQEHCAGLFARFDFGFEMGSRLYGAGHWVFAWTMVLALREPGGAPFTARVETATEVLARLAALAIRGEADALAELRARLGVATAPLPASLAAIVRAIEADPMLRMSQTELARRLGAERTAALRRFKAATGLTFRAFKRWSGLQHAARQIAAGVLVRTAAMDAGFADTAHLSRSFRDLFGLSPSAAIAGLGQGASAPLPDPEPPRGLSPSGCRGSARAG